jgi:rRNA maturation RNase YbeY
MSRGIRFFKENTKYIVKNKGNLRSWIALAIAEESKKAGELSFILCDDNFLAELNFGFLKHKRLTDILTFPTSEKPETVSGEIYISLERVKENACFYHQPLEVELQRVMIHGILHLIGYDDRSVEEKEIMRAKENYYLDKLVNR